MPPKAAAPTFDVDGVWLVQNGKLWNSVRQPSWPRTTKNIVVKADRTTTSDATRDAKIRKAEGFEALLKALAAVQTSDGADEGADTEQRID